MLKLYVNKSAVPVTITRFPAGESLVSIKDEQVFPVGNIKAMITFDFESNSDLIDLLMLTDCIRRYYFQKVDIALKMSYMPYARQDRVCNRGESLSVKVIADLINSQNYVTVYTTDAHSEVTPALLNNCINVPLDVCAYNLQTKFPRNNFPILVSPDAGANKKVFAFAKANGFPEVIRADKTRDVATGKITGTVVYSNNATVTGVDSEGNTSKTIIKDYRDFLILDDICDGGYTFIQLAAELRKLTTGKIYLYVTHGIFTKGVRPLLLDIDKIFVNNLMYKNLTDAEKQFVEII